MGRPRGRPGNQCTICRHPERARAELLLAGGAGTMAVAAKFGMSHDALGRHWRTHVSAERKAALVLGPVPRMELQARTLEESSSVIDHYRVVRAGFYQTFNAALESGDRINSIQAGRAIKEVCDSIAKVTGEVAASGIMHQHMHVHMAQAPEMRGFMDELAEQLAPFPEALKTVVEWLKRKQAPAPAPALPALEHQA